MRLRYSRLLAVLALSVAAMAVSAETFTVHCVYAKHSNPTGLHKTSTTLELTFIVDLANESAYMLGNNGSSKVEIIQAGDHMSFVELTQTGNVMTTTIDGNRNSVHSRNTVIGGALVPSQYYGVCTYK